MLQYPIRSPLVIVHNYLETFRDFLTRSGGIDALMSRRFNGDQALFWLGSDKLIISSAPISNAEFLSERWGYRGIKTIFPEEPSAQLSLDILNSEELTRAVIDHAGDQKRITMVCYAASTELYKLVNYLNVEHGIVVDLPELPPEEKLWLKHYIDTKVGFRDLVSKWVGAEHLPQGYVTNVPEMAAEMARDFADKGKGVVIKANSGGSGVGNSFFTAQEVLDGETLSEFFSQGAFTKNEIFVIEELIESTTKLSPSLEFFVPRYGEGEPVVTYLCNQHFEESGRFAGVIIADELYHAPWYPAFRTTGLAIASELQRLGYAGHFDLDAIVGDDGRLYLVEINSRRTGGTYVHEFLTRKYGKGYHASVAALSQNKISSRFIDLTDLETEIGGLLYPMDGKENGVIVLLTSLLSSGSFGYLVIGETISEVIAIRKKMIERLI